MDAFLRILAKRDNPARLTFVSSYVPRKCGIATFCRDLAEAVDRLNSGGSTNIIAMHFGDVIPYPPIVTRCIERDDPESYSSASQDINHSQTNIVCLQHEYGLFGGPAGSYILEFLKKLKCPVVTTLHTVLINPTAVQKEALQAVVDLSKAVVVMTADAKKRLVNGYAVSPKKIIIIPHGVAERAQSHCASKPELGWDHRPVLLLTGLLNSNKGADYVIKALPIIKARYPNILFALVGQTHPEVIKWEGEKYRQYLEKLVEDLGLANNMQFVNRYLDLEELLKRYNGCDVYLTPHLDQEQATSGTLAYALGMGKACVSTPYIYAREVLAGGTGILVDFKDEQSIATAVLKILDNPKLRAKMESATYKIGKQMTWPRVARSYLALFRKIIRAKD